MTTVLIHPCVLEESEEEVRKHLQARGVKFKKFDFALWIQNWLNDPAGTFWGRKIVIPKVGDVCMAQVEACKAEGEGFSAKGCISDTRCVVRGQVKFDENVKVRVVGRGEKSLNCVVADEGEELTRFKKVEYKIYYSASGITGIFQRLSWHDGGVNMMRIAPNESMPVRILAGFERMHFPPDVDRRFEVYVQSVGRGDESGYVPAVECGNCHGHGAAECEVCHGTGRVRCPVCKGEPEQTCLRCGGSGDWRKEVECRGCEGSGTYRNGSYSTTCNRCHGSGTVTITGTCNACGGTGVHVCKCCDGAGDVGCRACHGEGSQECWVCRGEGVRYVYCDYNTGNLSITGKNKERVPVRSEDVFLWRKRDKHRVPLVGDWSEIEKSVLASIDRAALKSRRTAELNLEIDAILKGLDEKILHKDTTQLPPVHAVLSTASFGRIHGRVIYHLKEKGVSAWKKAHNEPYPRGISLRIDGVDVPEGETIIYEGYDPIRRELEVSFPQRMDMSQLRGGELEIRSDEMRPPEFRQKEYLQRWKEATDSPIYKAIIEGCGDWTPEKGVKLFNKRIDQYSRQRKAVEYGVSEAPLFLLKGPPGTGKTTIIVEIIRQAIHKNQRVLLTSQTHQAVENVLEKLHDLVENGKDNAIHMVHYTAQEGKSSELARRYRDGFGTAEITAIRTKVSDNLMKVGKKVARLTDPSFLDSLKKLCEEGAACAERIADEKDASRIDMDRLDRELRDMQEKVDSETLSLMASLDRTTGDEICRERQRLSAKSEELSEVTKEINGSEKRVSEKQKRIRDLSDGSLGSKLLRVWSYIDEDYDVDVVKRQLGVAQKEKRAAVVKRGFLSGDVMEIQSGIVAKELTYRNEKARIERSAASRKSVNFTEVEAQRKRRMAEHTEALDKIKSVYLRQIENINRFLGNETGLIEESVASDWRDVFRRVEREGVRAAAIHDYITEWEKVLADKPEAVCKFLDSQSNVFLATCVGVGGWRSLMDGTYDRRFEDVEGIKREQFFDLVIVDEAGHATFAETVIPLSMGKRAILIGDDKQLPPIEDDDLKTYSMFTRFWEDEDCKVPKVMLDTQFRMHPAIADFVSDTFYNGELKNGVEASDRAFQFSSFNKPVCLLSTSNQPNHYETWLNPSYQNELEAKYVKEIVNALIAHCNEHGVKDETVSVAVITPYAEQVSLIRSKLKDVFGNSGNVRISAEDVASVDKFQGGERDVVIASFVRSPKPKARAPKLTFVHDLKRMNVAFSRPRKMLILVGDINALSTGLGAEEGRKAFEEFHRVTKTTGLEILAWERREK